MSSSYVSEALRRRVAARAGERCEYCKALRIETYSTLQIDHIVSEQHGGLTAFANLALACRRCNLLKGPNLTSILPPLGDIVVLFNPRLDNWTDHFAVHASGQIIGLTDTGKVTAQLLQFNTDPRVETRRMLYEEGYYAF